MILERLEMPLHTDASEKDLRGHVIKRKMSGGTQSETGRVAQDVPFGCYGSAASSSPGPAP